MKRTILVFFLFVCLSMLSFATTGPSSVLEVRGYYSPSISLDVNNISNTRFDMTSDIVQPFSNTNEYSTTLGFYIGTWSMYSDYASTTVKFWVEPLYHESMDSSPIHYYLQLSQPIYKSSAIQMPYNMTAIRSSEAESYTTLSVWVPTTSSTTAQAPIIHENGAYYANNESLYVRLASGYDKSVLTNSANKTQYPDGFYCSNVHIVIETGN